MSMMADPMIALREIQQGLSNGLSLEEFKLSDDYFTWNKDFPDGGKTYSYVKIVDQVIQTLSIFVVEEPHKGINRYSVGYAVNENYRGRKLAVEAVNKGIEDLKIKFGKNFYLEALIDEKNTHSINVAKQLFTHSAPSKDEETGTPALLFYKLIVIQ
jgi:RimJ/RimL family protein N-acetyltransferase